MKASKSVPKGERPALAEMLKNVRKALRVEGIKNVKLTVGVKDGQTKLQIHGLLDDRFLAEAAIYKHTRKGSKK